MIDGSNYEEYLVRYADGELNAAEENALLAFIAANPHLEGEMELFRQAHLVPDETVTYTNKRLLMKNEPKKSGWLPVILKSGNMRYAAIAASVALVIIGFAVWKHDQGYQSSNIRKEVLASRPSVDTPKADKVLVNPQVANTAITNQHDSFEKIPTLNKHNHNISSSSSVRIAKTRSIRKSVIAKDFFTENSNNNSQNAGNNQTTSVYRVANIEKVKPSEMHLAPAVDSFRIAPATLAREMPPAVKAIPVWDEQEFSLMDQIRTRVQLLSQTVASGVSRFRDKVDNKEISIRF